jgi:hypothetical protein
LVSLLINHDGRPPVFGLVAAHPARVLESLGGRYHNKIQVKDHTENQGFEDWHIEVLLWLNQ